jgi:hypothetical protein
MKYLKQTLVTYVYSHCNVCNISIYFCNIYTKHLQHTSETPATTETYVCNIGGRTRLADSGCQGGSQRRASTTSTGRALWVPLGSAGDDLRHPGTCTQPPSAGAAAAARNDDAS